MKGTRAFYELRAAARKVRVVGSIGERTLLSLLGLARLRSATVWSLCCEAPHLPLALCFSLCSCISFPAFICVLSPRLLFSISSWLPFACELCLTLELALTCVLASLVLRSTAVLCVAPTVFEVLCSRLRRLAALSSSFSSRPSLPPPLAFPSSHPVEVPWHRLRACARGRALLFLSSSFLAFAVLLSPPLPPLQLWICLPHAGSTNERTWRSRHPQDARPFPSTPLAFSLHSGMCT